MINDYKNTPGKSLYYCYSFDELSQEAQETAIAEYNLIHANAFSAELRDIVEECGLPATYDVMSEYGLAEDLDLLGNIQINGGELLTPLSEIKSVKFSAYIPALLPHLADKKDEIQGRIAAAILEDICGYHKYLTTDYPRTELQESENFCYFTSEGKRLNEHAVAVIRFHQIEIEDDLHDGKFLSYSALEKLEKRTPRREDYRQVYAESILLPDGHSDKTFNPQDICERLYLDSQQHLIPSQGSPNRSMSTSDVVEIQVGYNPPQYFFCNDYGFLKVDSSFVAKPQLNNSFTRLNKSDELLLKQTLHQAQQTGKGETFHWQFCPNESFSSGTLRYSWCRDWDKADAVIEIAENKPLAVIKGEILKEDIKKIINIITPSIHIDTMSYSRPADKTGDLKEERQTKRPSHSAQRQKSYYDR